MKKILSFIVLLAGVISITSCSSDDATYQATPKLEVASANVLFEAEGGDGSIVVNSSSTVSATTDASWLSLSVQGNKVIVTADPNLTLEGRSALIQLVSGTTKAEVTATQKSSVYGVPSLSYEIGDYQATLNIDVVHNQEVTVESKADWITATFNKETSQIEIVAEDNNEADPREGIVTVTMGEYSNDIVITQAGFLLEPEKEQYEVGNDETTLKISVKHSRVVTVKSNNEWITAAWNARTNELTCVVKANETGSPRAGTITLTSGTIEKTVTIIQYEFKDLFGDDYYLWFTQDVDSEDYYYVNNVSLSETSLDFRLYTRYPWSIPMTCDESTSTVTATCGCLVGQYSTYPIYLMFVDVADGGFWTGYTNDQTMSATLEVSYDAEYDELVIGGVFEGALLGTYPFDCWNFEVFSTNEFVKENDLGYLTRLYYVEIQRYIPLSGGESRRSSKLAKAKPYDITKPLMLRTTD